MPTLATCLMLVSAPIGLLPNGGFEEGGAMPDGWTLESAGGQATAERATGDASEGSAFARMTRADDGQADLRPATGYVQLTTGRAYLLTAYVRASNVADGSHSVELQWFSGGGFIGRDVAQARVGGRWVTVGVGPLLPPAGATRVIVLLRSHKAGTYDFDDVRLTEVPDMPQCLLLNPGFESDADGDGVPDGWTPSDQGAAVDTGVVASGQHSARLSREAADAPAAAWRQQGVAVDAGRRYELSAATRCDSFGRELRIAIEWSRGGEVLKTDEYRDQTLEAWQRKRLAAVCPPEADRASIILELVSEGTVWFDDVALSPQDVLAEVTLDIASPNPRGLLRRGLDADNVECACRATSAVEGARCRVTMIDEAGAERHEEQFALPSDARRLSVPTAAMPLGRYLLRADVLSPEGEALASDVAYMDVLPADAKGVFFRGDHVAVVNGAPWFPIGLTSISPTDDEAAGLAEAGFNLLITGVVSQGTSEEMRRVLDRAAQLGIYAMEWDNAWVYPPGGTPPDAREAALRKMAENAGDHPAFIGLMCDEAIWNGVPLSDVQHAYRTMRQLMPTRLFWQNQAPRNTIADLARYCRNADVSGMDIYPVDMPEHSDLPNKTLSVVGDEVRKNIATVEGRKPIWAILQGFGWNVWSEDTSAHKRAPTWDETRFMAYDAIVSGATGVIYWGASYEKRDTPIWSFLRRMASELRELTPMLVSSERVDIPATGGVLTMGRMVEGKIWVIAVNESSSPLAAELTLPEGTGPLARWKEDGPGPAVDGTLLRDEFAPFGLHVYR